MCRAPSFAKPCVSSRPRAWSPPLPTKGRWCASSAPPRPRTSPPSVRCWSVWPRVSVVNANADQSDESHNALDEADAVRRRRRPGQDPAGEEQLLRRPSGGGGERIAVVNDLDPARAHFALARPWATHPKRSSKRSRRALRRCAPCLPPLKQGTPRKPRCSAARRPPGLLREGCALLPVTASPFDGAHLAMGIGRCGSLGPFAKDWARPSAHKSGRRG